MTIHAASSQPLAFFWFIPTHGDGSYLGSERQQRPPEFSYFKEIAQAVDRLGFPGVLLPTGQNCEDFLDHRDGPCDAYRAAEVSGCASARRGVAGLCGAPDRYAR